MRSKSNRARVDRQVNRIDINRLQPAVESAPETDASGASDSVRENKNRVKRSGSKASRLRSAENTSAGSIFKRSSEKSSAKSPKSVSARVSETPAARSPGKSAKKVRTTSGKKSSSGKASGNRRHSAPAVSDPFLSADEAQSSADEMSEGRSLLLLSRTNPLRAAREAFRPLRSKYPQLRNLRAASALLLLRTQLQAPWSARAMFWAAMT